MSWDKGSGCGICFSVFSVIEIQSSLVYDISIRGLKNIVVLFGELLLRQIRGLLKKPLSVPQERKRIETGNGERQVRETQRMLL